MTQLPVHAPASKTPGRVERLLIDAHAHCHACYDERVFLEAAVANLSRGGEGLPTLLLCEGLSANYFSRWKSGAGPWPVEPRLNESESIVLDDRLLVIAGRQIITKEKVEVLALLTDEQFPDGLTTEATVHAVESGKGIAVLPWGAGKWLGKRYSYVRRALDRYPRALLGDNAGRPAGWPRPPLFSQRTTLPGTDPLRLPREATIIGSYGFALEGSFDLAAPAAHARAALLSHAPRIFPFGKRVGLLRFLQQQIGLRTTPKRP